tara:strand:+ start:436 stop:720 length:285 start_codon:yes stop_codon:yes gene_type:complete
MKRKKLTKSESIERMVETNAKHVEPIDPEPRGTRTDQLRVGDNINVHGRQQTIVGIAPSSMGKFHLHITTTESIFHSPIVHRFEKKTKRKKAKK